MATVLDRNRVAWTYHSDDGTDYRVAAQKAITDQTKLGGSDGSAVTKPKPAWIKMRRITVHNVDHGSRVVPVYTTDAAILADGGTVNLNVNNASFTFVKAGVVLAEKRPRQNVTSQAT